MIFIICCGLFLIGCMQVMRTEGGKQWKRLRLITVILFVLLAGVTCLASIVIHEDAVSMRSEAQILTVEVEHEDLLASETDGLTMEDRVVEYNERLTSKQQSADWLYFFLLIPDYYNNLSMVEYQ